MQVSASGPVAKQRLHRPCPAAQLQLQQRRQPTLSHRLRNNHCTALDASHSDRPAAPQQQHPTAQQLTGDLQQQPSNGYTAASLQVGTPLLSAYVCLKIVGSTCVVRCQAVGTIYLVAALEDAQREQLTCRIWTALQDSTA